MSIISFRAPIAICAAVGAVIVALSPVAHADERWGACAAPVNTAIPRAAACLGDYFGEPSPGRAESEAMTLCTDWPPVESWRVPAKTNRQCTVLVSYTDCGAIAGNGSQWAGGRGATKELTEQDALRGLANGKITTSACLLTE
jgi:hypothetical protein